MTNPPDRPPASLTHLARERAAARAARDFSRADALRAEIEAAGWKVVDRSGGGTILERVAPPDVLEGPEPRYGASERVPSRLGEPATATFTVVILADDRPRDVSLLLDALRDTAPPGTQVVIVANAPSEAQEAALSPGSEDLAPIGGLAPEIVRTTARLGHATALNVGLRRAAGEIVVLADASAVPSGDALTPLARALSDPSVAVAGAFGLDSSDLQHFEPGRGPEVAAIDGTWMAFRRADAARLGPLDEHFAVPRHLDEWWSLKLRAGEAGEAPRRAVLVDLPVARRAVESGDMGDTVETGGTGGTGGRDPEIARLEKRNAYRVQDAFRERRDLAVG